MTAGSSAACICMSVELDKTSEKDASVQEIQDNTMKETLENGATQVSLS